jgi:hypothetical protein
MAKITPNSVWRLSSDFGIGPGFVPAGAELVVDGLYPPGTPGIGHIDEDTVLAHYARPDAGPQTIAVPVSEFSALCKAVS